MLSINSLKLKIIQSALSQLQKFFADKTAFLKENNLWIFLFIIQFISSKLRQRTRNEYLNSFDHLNQFLLSIRFSMIDTLDSPLRPLQQRPDLT